MEYVKTSSKFQIVIPKGIRTKLNIKAGQKLALRVAEDHLEIYPLFEDPVEALTGMFKGCGWTTEDYLKEKRREYEREKKKYGF